MRSSRNNQPLGSGGSDARRRLTGGPALALTMTVITLLLAEVLLRIFKPPVWPSR